jgi:hypothetical protein
MSAASGWCRSKGGASPPHAQKGCCAVIRLRKPEGCSLWKRFLRDEAQIAKPSDVFEHQRVTLALIAEALAQ